MARKVKKGTLVSVTFDDHVRGGGKPIRFQVWGRVHECNAHHLTVACWDYLEPNYDENDENVDSYTILQSAITKLVRL